MNYPMDLLLIFMTRAIIKNSGQKIYFELVLYLKTEMNIINLTIPAEMQLESISSNNK